MTRFFASRASSQGGFVIVAVLWLLAALAALVTVFSIYLSNSARALAVTDEAVQAEGLVSAGVELTAYQLQLAGDEARPTHGSFHTTISALEALLDYERFRPAKAQRAREAQARGREFLLVHRLFRSHRTGKVVKPEMTRFFYPPRWHYDVLRALDYFRDSGASLDPRLEDALRLLEQRRRKDGRWEQQNEHPGKTFFRLVNVGGPSRWNTLRALRVLRWMKVNGEKKRTP